MLRLSYLLHVVPVGNDTVLDGVLEGEDTSLALGLIADVEVLLAHALVMRAAHDGREHGARCFITGEPGFAHAGAVVNNQCSNVLVAHYIMPKRPSLLQPEFINMPCPTHRAPLFVRGKIRDLVDA